MTDTAAPTELLDESQPDEELDLPDSGAGDGEDEVDPLTLPGAQPAPIDTRNVRLDDIAERGNIRKTHGVRPLAVTMHLEGQLMPVLVRPAPADADHGRPFELIFGHRRKMAAELLGWEEIRAEVRDVPDVERLVQMFVENYQREDLSPVEQAYTMLALKEEMGWSQARIARELGCDPSHVSHRLSLLKLAMPEPVAPVKELPPATDDPEAAADRGDDQPDSADEDDAAASALPAVVTDDRKRVDILGLVDQGRLSASAAEVIAGLEDRDVQEKVAGLATRYDWSVKQVEKYTRKMKEQEIVEGPEEMGPVEMVTMDDVVELQQLKLRELTRDEYDKINLFALLRNAMDQEMLEYLQEAMGYSYDYLWSYVDQLDSGQVRELVDLMLRRYMMAAHRFHDLPPELVDALSLPAGATDDEQAHALAAAKLTLPGALEDPETGE